MTFSKQDIKKFAEIIHIEISDEKLDAMNLNADFDRLARIQKIPAAGTEPMITPMEGTAEMRDDIVADGNCLDALMANVPDAAGKSRGFFAVPKVAATDE